ncbi:MAG: hypothetical protein JWN47_1841 [Frankiales bacterium]|nr:hypothetical protein [Frankiales bacterium]
MSEVLSLIGVPARTSVLGHWDSLDPDGAQVGGDIRLSGWALTNGPTAPTVTIFRDGLRVRRVQAVTQRADLESLYGRNLTGGGWECVLQTSHADIGSQLHATVTDGTGAASLGHRLLQAPTRSTLAGNDSAITGSLEEPLKDQVALAGGVLTVEGWVLFGDRPADVIELSLGDRYPIRIRRAKLRSDVANGLGVAHPSAVACGFSDLVSIPADWAGRTVNLQITATGPSGRTWTTPQQSIVIAPRPEPAEVLDRLGPLIARSKTRVTQTTSGSGSDRLRVCVFTHSLNLGGGELYLQELLVRMARNHDVDLMVVSPIDGPLKRDLLAAGIEVHITNHYAVDAAHYLGRISELGMIALAFGADAVVVNTLGAFAAVDGALEAGLPVFWAIHESFDFELFTFLNWGDGGLHPGVRERWIACLEQAQTIFEADATRAMFADMVPGLQGRCVRYGINLEEIQLYRKQHDRADLRRALDISPGQRVLLCMGIFQERKSQLALVVAFAEVAETFPDVLLVLVGYHGSNYALSVETTVRALGLSDRVRILPVVRDTHAWYHAADILVSSSDTESLPRSMMEAHAFGLPVLAADVFGMPEIIRDGENGWLFSPRSGLSLVATLRRILGLSTEALAAVAAQCVEDSVRYDGSGYAAEYVRLINDARAGQPGQHERKDVQHAEL